MITSVKIKLMPTKHQEYLMWQSVHARRYAYNWGLEKANELYKQGINWNKIDVRNSFTQHRKCVPWLKEVSSQTTGQSFEDLNNAMQRFFKHQSKRPNFKSRKRTRNSFYVRYDAIKFNNNTVNMEKIGKVKYKSNQKFPVLPKYIKPTCSFDGKYWILSFGFEQEYPRQELTEETVGIDLGVKDLAIISNIEKPIPNINKTQKVRKLDKRLRRLQRQVSKKYEINKEENEFKKTKNIVKLEQKIKLVHRDLRNIRNNHIHQTTAMIVRTKPSRVVMEDLKVQEMIKNRHLAKAISEQNFYEFRRQMEYKCERSGIEFVLADRWFPSSKTCSDCGFIHKGLKLSDRTFICPSCSFKLDRDKNASINLARYQVI